MGQRRSRIPKTVAIGIVSGALWLACGHEPSTCPENLSIDISNAVLAVYNGGTGSGTINATFTCPSGGSGTVTGTRGLTNYDYTVDFLSCLNVGTESSLTLTGTIHDTTDISTHIETAHADSLQIVGTETACTASAIQASCEVDFSFDGRDSAGVPMGSGSICGLTFP